MSPRGVPRPTVGPWVVLLREQSTAYGPFDDEVMAQQFAEFLRVEVDPAVVIPLRSPARELLTCYRTQRRGWS
jgi:hypothetical protein